MASTSAYVVIHCKLRCVEDGDEPCLCEPKVVGVFLALDNANEEARREFDVNVLIAAGMIGEDAKDFAEYGDDGTVKYSAPDLSEGAVVYVEEHPLTDAYDEDEEDDDQQEGAPADAHAAYPPPEDEEDDDFADEGDEEEDEAPPPGAKRKKM